jgi:hypothetical protein
MMSCFYLVSFLLDFDCVESKFFYAFMFGSILARIKYVGDFLNPKSKVQALYFLMNM